MKEKKQKEPRIKRKEFTLQTPSVCMNKECLLPGHKATKFISKPKLPPKPRSKTLSQKILGGLGFPIKDAKRLPHIPA